MNGNDSNDKDTSNLQDWTANILARIDALPEPDARRSHMLREEGRTYEFLRLAAFEGHTFRDDFMNKLDTELPAHRDAFKAILSIALEASSASLMTYLEQAITDAEVFDVSNHRSPSASPSNDAPPTQLAQASVHPESWLGKALRDCSHTDPRKAEA
jgi:hypothetical protein